MSDREELALANCASEPIHRPGRIQPFGVLLAGPRDLARVDFCSENAFDLLARSPADVLGTPFGELFPPDLLETVRKLLSSESSGTQRERAGRMEVAGQALEVFIHRNPNHQAVMELEPLDGLAAGVVDNPIDRMRLVLSQASTQPDLTSLLEVCVHGLRDLIGYHRVMAYRYAPNGDGEVVAESLAPLVESFLGLRYPAQDVPAQARALQVRNPVRMLVDVGQTPIALLGRTDDPNTLDISLAHLRGVSPVHVEYLQNMGVKASLTIALVADGKLWGMFSCHHNEPRVIRSDVRIAAELFGQMISLMVQQKIELEAAAARVTAEAARRKILAAMDAAVDPVQSFPDLAPVLANVIVADGVAVMRDSTIQVAGSTPCLEAVGTIATRRPDDDELIDHTEQLPHAGWGGAHGLGASAGCLLIRCTAATPLQVMFFRDEKTRNVNWAGSPAKTVTESADGPRLHPRKSFKRYMEEQRGIAPDWSVTDLEAARELQKILTQSTEQGDRTQMMRHKDLLNHQRQQDLMIAELNHRVKNILALIRSVSRQAKASSMSLESYVHALEQRIAALAAAHDLALSNTTEGVSLRGILETELRPYLADDSGQALLSGPTVGLRADVAPMIALVVHEVVTNAAKYGALSTPDGVVRAKWSKTNEGLHFEWRELGGPDVAPPERQGFGRSLIEKAIPYEFDGDVQLDYPASGVRFSFRLPAETLVDLGEETGSTFLGHISEIKRVASGTAALVVEDNIVLAMDMVESLTRLGVDTVDTASSVDEALHWVDKKHFDFAVLDLNLRGVVSFDVAERLQETGTPFVFVTGYGASVTMPPVLTNVPILTKPVDEGTLAASLGKILPNR